MTTFARMFTIKINFKNSPEHLVILQNIETGQSLLEIFLNNNIPIDHECGGICACSTCHLYINKGRKHFDECSIREEHFLDKVAKPEHNSRLACQCVLLDDDGEVEVTIPEQTI